MAAPGGPRDGPDSRIPGRLNVVLAVAAATLALGLLWFASHVGSWPWLIAAALVFSYVNNTIFSLLHEAVHGHFHARRAVNEWSGRLLAAFFPTGLTFQRICHLGHHRRNRTSAELFDYLRPDDNRLLKYLQWYGVLTGVYWLASPLGCLLYFCCPWLLGLRMFQPASQFGRQTSTAAMLSGFEGAPGAKIRLEIALGFSLQAAAFWLLDLSLAGWLVCYAAFAVNWSSLQYADHAWSALDVHEGAWNLEVNPLVQALFLNYHHHKAHHQNPQVPWLHLPEYVDFSAPRPSFLRIYLSMWRGPRRYPAGGGGEDERRDSAAA